MLIDLPHDVNTFLIAYRHTHKLRDKQEATVRLLKRLINSQNVVSKESIYG